MSLPASAFGNFFGKQTAASDQATKALSSNPVVTKLAPAFTPSMQDTCSPFTPSEHLSLLSATPASASHKNKIDGDEWPLPYELTAAEEAELTALFEATKQAIDKDFSL
jgi:hypothetical protein